MNTNLVVSKDNQLIQASYTLPISAQRVILLCIAKLDSRKKIDIDYEFTLSVDDLALETGVSRENSYRDLRKAVNCLYDSSIMIDVNDPDSKLRWIFEKRFSKTKREVVLSFSPKIIPYISELKSRFTTYKLRDVANFTCSYSVRIFELIMQWKDKNEIKIEIGRLRDILQLNDKYPRIIDLKRHVITPSLNDINTHSKIRVSVEQVKNGKEITHLLFVYFEISGVNETKKIIKDDIVKHARPGESYNEVKNRLKKLRDNLK